jgi:hypothetical protein
MTEYAGFDREVGPLTRIHRAAKRGNREAQKALKLLVLGPVSLEWEPDDELRSASSVGGETRARTQPRDWRLPARRGG